MTTVAELAAPEYPKIETLWDRDPVSHKIIAGRYRLPEFSSVSVWYVTEKIDGTNVRVAYDPSSGTIAFGGRTDSAQMPVKLLAHLTATFTADAMRGAFPDATDRIVLYGEGYGAGIQKGGGNYRSDQSFRLFDVMVGGLWLEPVSIDDIASKLGILTVPTLGVMGLHDATSLVRPVPSPSYVTKGSATPAWEGIVARSLPLMLTRTGHRIMWKLKSKDIPQ